MKTWALIYVLIVAMNLAFWFTAGMAFSLFAAGLALGVLYCHLLDWYFDRRIRREIMDEINTLTRFHDQMTLFETYDTNFPKNTTKKATNND